jgi:hypothetical protein
VSYFRFSLSRHGARRREFSFFLSFLFLILTSLYLLIVGVEDYFWTWSHTVTHILCKTPLDEGSVRRRDLYLTTHNIHKRQTSMTAAGFEPTTPASYRPQTHVLGCAATEIGEQSFYGILVLCKAVFIIWRLFNPFLHSGCGMYQSTLKVQCCAHTGYLCM